MRYSFIRQKEQIQTVNNNIQLLHNVTIKLLACKKSYSFRLLCVPCQEITQDCTQSLLRNHLNYVLKVKSRRMKKGIYIYS